MKPIKQLGIPILASLSIYELGKKGHLFGITFLWLFTIDIALEKTHVSFTFGIGSLYAQAGLGVF